MSGRIRTLKPEWLEDELMMMCTLGARVLSVSLILLADDYGNGRAHPAMLRSRAMPLSDLAEFSAALAELVAIRFVVLYEVDGQQYYAIRNWAKHQRVDKPGKPRVPGPDDPQASSVAERKRVAYFVRGTSTGLIKIGESFDPVARVAELSRTASESLELLAVGGTEREHHAALVGDRVHGEWFAPSAAVLDRVRELGGNPEKPIVTVGYKGTRRHVESAPPGAVPETVGNLPGTPAPDRDRDLDHDRERDRDRGSPGHGARSSAPNGSQPPTLAALGDEIRNGIRRGFEDIDQPAPRETKGLTWPGWQDLAGWVREKARLLDEHDELAIARHLVRCFLRSQKAALEGWPVRFLVQNPAEYWRDELPPELGA